MPSCEGVGCSKGFAATTEAGEPSSEADAGTPATVFWIRWLAGKQVLFSKLAMVQQIPRRESKQASYESFESANGIKLLKVRMMKFFISFGFSRSFGNYKDLL